MSSFVICLCWCRLYFHNLIYLFNYLFEANNFVVILVLSVCFYSINWISNNNFNRHVSISPNKIKMFWTTIVLSRLERGWNEKFNDLIKSLMCISCVSQSWWCEATAYYGQDMNNVASDLSLLPTMEYILKN